MLKWSPLALACVSALSFAQTKEHKDLEHISVYASRQATPVSKTLTSVTVLDRAAIEAAQVRDLPALLQQIPGITVARQGGRGQNSSVFIRGASSAQTLVLIDGVRVGAATTGYQALAMVPLEQIEQIEIIRGPKAVLYGSAALGGVIAITSRKSEVLNFNAKVGSHEHAEVSLAGSQQYDAVRLFGSVGTAMADGFNVSTKGDPDRDGFQQSYLKTGAEYKSRVGNWLWQSQLNDGRYQFDNGYLGDESKIRQETHLAQWEHQIDTTRHQLKVAHSIDEDTVLGRRLVDDLYLTKRNEADWQSVSQLTADLSLLAGVNYSQERVSTTPKKVWKNDGTTVEQGYAVDQRINKAVFAGANYQWSKLLVDATGRRDYVSKYGGESTYQLNAGYQLTDALQVRAGKSTAFKVPSFNDLYWPGYENPTLAPEQSVSNEVGLDYVENAVKSSLVYFHRDLTNLIRYQDRTVFNVKKARIRGAELAQSLQIADIDLSFNYTWLQADDLQKKQRLTLLPKHKAVLQLDWSTGPWTYGVNSLYQSRTFNGKDWSGVLQPDLPSTVVFGSAVSYQWDKQTKIQLKIDNLFDRTYQTSLGYRQSGVSFTLGLQLSGF